MTAELPSKPNNREEQYLASIAGQDVATPACPYSRKEAYLEAIDGKMDDIEQEIEDLKNNPDVVDIVDTYADLQAYDTSTLTDKDIIRVLNDETHDGASTFYRWNAATSSFDYIGEAGGSVDVFVGTDGTEPGQKGLVPAPAVTDAGKYLKADGSWSGVPDEILKNAGAPTTSTVGAKGQLLIDTTNAKLYQCTAVDNTDPQNPTYTWTEVGGSSVNVVQTTGTSTTDVMSQNAVTAQLRPVLTSDTSVLAPGQYLAFSVTPGSVRTAGTNDKGNFIANIANNVIRTGGSAVDNIVIGGRNNNQMAVTGAYQVILGIDAVSSGNGTVTLGYGASTSSANNYPGMVAIGAFSKAVERGEMNIGSTETGFGYNNSNYRLLTGVYDGQSAHDAATVAQGNTLATTAPTTTTVGVLGQLYTDTTNMHTYQCTAIDTTDPQNPVYTWTQRW